MGSQDRKELGALAGRVILNPKACSPTALRHLTEACSAAGFKCVGKLQALLEVAEDRENVMNRLGELQRNGHLSGTVVNYTRLDKQVQLVKVLSLDSGRQEVKIKTPSGSEYCVDAARIAFIT